MADLDWYDEDAEQRRLYAILAPRYRGMLAAVHDAVREAYELAADEFRLDDAAVRRVLAEAARQVVRIDARTRATLRERLQDAQRRGLSNRETADAIDDLFTETWKGRPDTIARTELQHAQNVAALDRYAETGLVDRVRIIDGDQDAPCAGRNGTTVPLADRPQLAHPNCTLVVVPVLRGE
jgi:hypothetical protein